MDIRDYSPPQVRTQDGFVRRRNGFGGANLIQSPSRIKRASRHVPLISILDQRNTARSLRCDRKGGSRIA